MNNVLCCFLNWFDISFDINDTLHIQNTIIKSLNKSKEKSETVN
jgi:hypothetical protein